MGGGGGGGGVGQLGEVRRPRKKWNECVMEDMNLLLGEGACCAGSIDVESSHHPSNLMLNGKIWTLNENDDDKTCIMKSFSSLFSTKLPGCD